MSVWTLVLSVGAALVAVALGIWIKKEIDNPHMCCELCMKAIEDVSELRSHKARSGLFCEQCIQLLEERGEHMVS
jgi:hypothetical protein